MNPEPKHGNPIDPQKPNGAKWGDPGHPLPEKHLTRAERDEKRDDKRDAKGEEEKPSARAMGQTFAAPDNSGCPQIGDVVTLKSGGPSMTVIGLDEAQSLPGGPASDPEITPERRAAGQTSLVVPSLATVNCQWFTENGECKEKSFSINALKQVTSK